MRIYFLIFPLELTWLQIEYHVECLSVLGDLLIQPGEVESVLDVLLVHLAEELVATQPAKPCDPRNLQN